MLNIKDIEARNHQEPPEVKAIRENIRNSFRRLEFQEGLHKYYVHNDDNSVIELPSVSAMTHKFKPEFETDYQAEAYALKHDMRKEDVLRIWEENNIRATNRGSLIHLYAEGFMHFFMGNINDIPPTIKFQYEKGYLIPYGGKQEAVLQFYEDLFVNDKIYPVMPEAQVYLGLTDEYKKYTPYAGTFDMLFTYKANDGKWKLLIYDWKTNQDLYSPYNRKFNNMALNPFDKYYDEAYSYYVMQLSCYSLCLMQLGYEIADRKIIWLKDDGTYEKISVPDITDTMKQALLIK